MCRLKHLYLLHLCLGLTNHFVFSVSSPLRRKRFHRKRAKDVAGGNLHTDKKENQIFVIYKEIQSGAVAKSYITNGLLIYGEIFAHILGSLIYDFATAPL